MPQSALPVSGGAPASAPPGGPFKTTEGADADETNKPPPAANWVQPSTTQGCREHWMGKLSRGDLSGVPITVECFIPLRGSIAESNFRATDDYKDRCCEAVGLGAVYILPLTPIYFRIMLMVR